MEEEPNTTKCFSCGAFVPDVEGPVHRYMDSSPGCWKLYGQILEKGYSNSEYKKVSRLTMDAYAVQHYGKAAVPQAVTSVNHHLISLCFYFDYDFTAEQSNTAFRELADYKDQFEWLEPPKSVGAITVADVIKTTTAEDYLEIIKEWAYQSWMAWSQHHVIIQSFIKKHSKL